ncbi:MAG: NERD domain-containing protein [Actinomycetota bacterium]
MAQMFPPEFGSGPWSEETVYDAFSDLSDEWFVVHDVAFAVDPGDRDPLEDGQADFVLLHPTHGVLVVEVKGGFVQADRGRWTTTNSQGVHQIRDPFKQATRNKWALLKQLRKKFGIDPWVMHAVCFPSTAEADGPVGLYEPEFAMFQGDLASPQAAIDRVVAAHRPRPQGLSLRQLEQIAHRLAPTVTIQPLLGDAARTAETELLRLTEQQRHILQFARSFPRAWISGGAGTGKTVLALEKARQLAHEGLHVLLLCFNEPLGRYLREQASSHPTITAGNYHNVATRIAGLVRPPDMSEAAWLDHGFSDAFFDHCVSMDQSWDAVIIDEGQDFTSVWLETLEQLLVDDHSTLLVFADENQALFRGCGAAGLPSAPLQLDLNCRNTPQIGRRVGEAIGIHQDCMRRTDGLEPTLVVADGRAGLLRTMRTEVHQLIVEQSVPLADVVVLSPSRRLIDHIQGTRLGRWTAVTAFEPGLVCETIQRFKGLEASAVILLLPDDGPINELLLYVGMSRARSILRVIAEPAARAELRWSEVFTPPGDAE